MSGLYYLTQTLQQRIAGVDTDLRTVEKQNYLSSNVTDRTIALLPLTNVVLVNGAGRYLMLADVSSDTAKVKLYVDGNYLEFDNFFSGIVSGTVLSVTADIATSLSYTLIEIS